MKDVTAELLKGEDYRGEKKVNRYGRLDLLYNRLNLIAEKLNPLRLINIMVMADGVCEQEEKGTIQDARMLIECYSETHTMELYTNRARNQLIIELGKKVHQPADKAG